MTPPPIYIKVEEYQELLDISSLTKERLKKARQILATIKNLKAQEDAAIADWASKLDAIEQRLTNVDKRLFHKGG